MNGPQHGFLPLTVCHGHGATGYTAHLRRESEVNPCCGVAKSRPWLNLEDVFVEDIHSLEDWMGICEEAPNGLQPVCQKCLRIYRKAKL